MSLLGWRILAGGVRDKLAVVYKIYCSCIVQCLVDQEGQLEIDSLSDRKPVELPQNWYDVVTSTNAGDKSRCRVLRRLYRRLNRLSVMPLNRALQ